MPNGRARPLQCGLGAAPLLHPACRRRGPPPRLAPALPVPCAHCAQRLSGSPTAFLQALLCPETSLVGKGEEEKKRRLFFSAPFSETALALFVLEAGILICSSGWRVAGASPSQLDWPGQTGPWRRDCAKAWWKTQAGQTRIPRRGA